MARDAEQFCAGCVGSPLQLEGEQQVGELALPVSHPLAVALLPLQIVESNFAHAMRATGDVGDPCAFGGEQPIEQQAGQREMPQVIGAELHLEAVHREAVRDRHDAGVVAEHVQRGMPPMERVGEAANDARFERSSSIA